MATNFQLFGLTHIAILGAVLLIAALLSAVQRRLAPGSKSLRLGLAWVILLETIGWDTYLAVHGQLRFPAQLPVELCDVTVYLTVIALFTLSAPVFDLAYYGLFKCNLKRIADYPALNKYLRRMLEFRDIRETVNVDHIKRGYYTIRSLNPNGIVPIGPDLRASGLA